MNEYRITSSDLKFVKYFRIEDKYDEKERVNFHMALNLLTNNLCVGESIIMVDQFLRESIIDNIS